MLIFILNFENVSLVGYKALFSFLFFVVFYFLEFCKNLTICIVKSAN